jgi:2-haloacid dehalogenase
VPSGPARSTDPGEIEAVDPGQIEAVLFDIIGTLVDENGTVRADTSRALEACGHDVAVASKLADEWVQRLDERISEVSSGWRPWRPYDQLSRETLQGTLDKHGVRLPDAVFGWLARVGHRLVPWPDAVRQLSDLAKLRPVFGLTNAGLAQVAEMSFYGGLRWHTILSTERVRTFKPNPATYQLAIDVLQLRPEQTLFVAAHPWDLTAAKRQRFRTAYLPRPHADPPGPFDTVDMTLRTLDDLLPLLNTPRTPPEPPDKK